MGYLAHILLRLDVWNAPGLGTYAVDDRWRLYIDFDHVMRIETVEQGAESLLHECGHLLGEHAQIANQMAIPRSLRRVWNVAADAAINDDLEAAGFTSLRGMWVTPGQFGAADNLTPQEYYRVLADRLPPQRKNAEGGNGDDDENPFSGCGSGSGGFPAPCEMDGDTGDPVTPMEAEHILIETAKAVVRARGTAPGGLVEAAEDALRPSVTPWQRLLAAYLRSAAAWVAGHVDQSYARRSRRRDNVVLRSLDGRPGRKLIKPGWVAPRPRIEVVCDTSASMSSRMISQARAEVEGIARKIGGRGDNLVYTEVDTMVQSSARYRDERSLGAIRGRGGTDMRVGIDAALARSPRPDIIVVLTDGETPWPEVPTPVPLVVCLIGEHLRASPPSWAHTVKVTSDD